MKGEGLLLGISQLALGLAGFAGIVGAFRRSSEEWKPQDFMGLRIILELTLASAICALLPLVLYLAYENDAFAIQWSSLILGLFFCLHFSLELRRSISFRRRGLPPRHPLLHVLFLLVPQLAFSVVAIMNFLWMSSAFFYAGMLIFLLLPASIQFFALANPLDKDFLRGKARVGASQASEGKSSIKGRKGAV